MHQRVDLDDVVQRWQLIRPTVELQRTGALPPWLATDASTGATTGQLALMALVAQQRAPSTGAGIAEAGAIGMYFN